MDKECGIASVPLKSKYRLWNKFCPNVKTIKGSLFSKCHFCIMLANSRSKAVAEKDHGKEKLIKAERQQHWDDIREERNHYYARRTSSRLDPKSQLCIIFDAMDQCKTSLPILRRRVSKDINSRVIPPIKTYLTGALVHRNGISHNKIGKCYFDFMQYSHDSNLNVSVLLQILRDHKQELGQELHIQMDSASNNKNSLMIAFGGLLVHSQIFKEVYFHMLPVGHTHEDIDAMFHNIADVLKVDVLTFPDMATQIKNIRFIESVAQLQTVWNVKEWLEPFMYRCHHFNDSFHIRIHFNQGNVVWHYKKWTKDKWFPDPTDHSTYVNTRDQHGILIFKDIPSGLPTTVQPNSSEITKHINQVGQKLIKSSLLSSEEKEWWEGAAEEISHNNVEEVFPLEELKVAAVHEERPIILSQQLCQLKSQQKRVNVAYSGKYLNPEKKKRLEKEDDITTDIEYEEEDTIKVPVTTRSGRQATTILY